MVKHGPKSKYWKTKADKAWAIQVRQIGCCEVCGGTSHLNAHHLINRTRTKYRHNLDNGVCLCVGCHTFGGNGIAAHGSQDVTTVFSEWLQEQKPEQYAWLMEHRDDKRMADENYEDAYLRLTGTQGFEVTQ